MPKLQYQHVQFQLRCCRDLLHKRTKHEFWDFPTFQVLPHVLHQHLKIQGKYWCLLLFERQDAQYQGHLSRQTNSLSPIQKVAQTASLIIGHLRP